MRGKINKIIIILIVLICFFNSSIDIYASEKRKTKIEVKYEQMETIDILAICVEAEAGNQDQYGKRLVADVILNRVDSDRFPDDVFSVISQKYHFTTYWDGSMDKISEPSEETLEAVKMELEDRTDDKILFFTAGDYNPYCIPAYKYGAHYFGY